MRAGQMLGDRAPHAAQRLAPAARLPAPGGPAHGGLGHGAVAGERGEVDAELRRQPPHGRRRLDTTAAPVPSRPRVRS